MFCYSLFELRRTARLASTVLLAIVALLVPSQSAFALITGGKGNEALHDPGWPKGAAVIFNSASRIAWWEGPPFGGGQWRGECRGDAKALSDVLADFARLEVKNKRVVLHDGVGNSFWLNPNGEPAKQKAAEIDWSFMVWQPENWNRLRKLPLDLNPTVGRGTEDTPPAQLDVYTGGKLRWSDVKVPAGLQVSDERLEAHGFKPSDGVVLEGAIVDLSNKRPIAATVRLERVEPQPKGGYRYTSVESTSADDKGHWVLKNTPAGRFRVVVQASGYVSRVIGYIQHDGQPRWERYDSALSQPAPVVGRVTDDAGKPLEGVDVRLSDAGSELDGRYDSPDEYKTKTDAEGGFKFESFPTGAARVFARKEGYCQIGTAPTITAPTVEAALTMSRSAQVQVSVDFGGKKPLAEYLVNMQPEGGEAVGKWSGSSQIDAKHQANFKNVPPGRYVLRGQPNPSSAEDQSEPVTVNLKGGETIEVTVIAR